MKTYFTSESVTSGHPDKICDYIADSILDEAIKQDPYAHMAIECTIKDDTVFIYGESHTTAKVDYEKVALDVLKEIGYHENYHVMCVTSVQSAEIDNAVDESKEICAGDQGIMFGYACNETENYMPLSIDLAHRLAYQLEKVRREKYPNVLMPDGKTQVTVEYDDNKIKRIDTIVISTQHVKDVTQEEIKDIVTKYVIQPIVPSNLMDEHTKLLINPSGSFVVGGSFGDSGTTGRKIVVDTYGGVGHIGGGCFSSKDPTKVDRSAAYYSRYVCKSLVAAKLCDRCELQVSYAIGEPKPLSININTFGTSSLNEEQLIDIINKNFDFSVSNIIKELDLRKPIYRQTTNYGHFGKPNLTWEKIKEITL